jgi:hypothetical protein
MHSQSRLVAHRAFQFEIADGLSLRRVRAHVGIIILILAATRSSPLAAQEAGSPTMMLLGAPPEKGGQGRCVASPTVPAGLFQGRKRTILRFEVTDDHFGLRQISVVVDSAGRLVGYTENTVYNSKSGETEMHGVTASISPDGRASVFRLPEKSDSLAIRAGTWKVTPQDTTVQRRVLELAAAIRKRCEPSGNAP